MDETHLYKELVDQKYKTYSEFFLRLPFSPLHRYGEELPLFKKYCVDGLQKGNSPLEIVECFFKEGLIIDTEEERERVLFLFLQLIEREIVLFDALEDTAKPQLYAKYFKKQLNELPKQLPAGKSIRLVLTAHPTQFYPDSVLGIIHDLSRALDRNDLAKLRKLLLQLGYTSLKNPKRPTPLEEAQMLIDHFGDVFYETIVDLAENWSEHKDSCPTIELGFWPGGDRDGHPFVTVDTTRAVVQRLRSFILNKYISEFEKLRRRITFKHAIPSVNMIREKLHQTLETKSGYETPEELIEDLVVLKELVKKHHGGLFGEIIERFIYAVQSFGFYFASLDIRQSSQVIERTTSQLFQTPQIDEHWLIKTLEKNEKKPTIPNSLEGAEKDLIEVLQAIPHLKKENGEKSCHRFIISHCQNTSHILLILLLARSVSGEIGANQLDIVPLFESIEDLQRSHEIMEQLFNLPVYRKHLSRRGNQQTVMFGFSDGTKDGGYLTCNWEIQKAKEALSKLADEKGVEVIFFDGRGGPAARGGGNTGKYYQSIGERHALHTIQQTIQGQTISSHYGTVPSAKYNLLELLLALSKKPASNSLDVHNNLIAELSDRAHQHYMDLREHPLFLPLLSEATLLQYFELLNVASRPPKRRKDEGLSLDNLRAIPFVGAWSLMKLNISAYYGLGFAFDEMEKEGREEELHKLFAESSYFQVLLGNTAQALRKSFYPLTNYLTKDPKFKTIWQQLLDEAKRTEKWVLRLRGESRLLENDPIVSSSIALREDIILPLLVIQHASLMKVRKSITPERNTIFKKLILKSIPPSINASRNSA